LPKPEYDKLQHAKGLGRFFKTASEVVVKEEETKRNVKEHIKEIRAEESKRVEAVVNTATLYGSRKKDTLDQINASA
jgi:Ribonuclease G/E